MCTASVLLGEVPVVLIGCKSEKDIPGLGIYPLGPDINIGKAESPVVEICVSWFKCYEILFNILYIKAKLKVWTHSTE